MNDSQECQAIPRAIACTVTPKERIERPWIGTRSTSKQQWQHGKIQEESVVENEDEIEINFTVPAEGHVILEDEKVNNVFLFCSPRTNATIINTFDTVLEDMEKKVHEPWLNNR